MCVVYTPAVEHDGRVQVRDPSAHLLPSLREVHRNTPCLPSARGMLARLLHQPRTKAPRDRRIVSNDQSAFRKHAAIDRLLVLQPDQPSH
jgi:hypothetical protein